MQAEEFIKVDWKQGDKLYRVNTVYYYGGQTFQVDETAVKSVCKYYKDVNGEEKMQKLVISFAQGESEEFVSVIVRDDKVSSESPTCDCLFLDKNKAYRYAEKCGRAWVKQELGRLEANVEFAQDNVYLSEKDLKRNKEYLEEKKKELEAFKAKWNLK